MLGSSLGTDTQIVSVLYTVRSIFDPTETPSISRPRTQEQGSNGHCSRSGHVTSQTKVISHFAYYDSFMFSSGTEESICQLNTVTVLIVRARRSGISDYF